MLPQLDIQYCCFDDCFGANAGLYGVALFSAADKTILLYTSSVNCPGLEKTIAEGAQFDIQANTISSQQVNASTSQSWYCGAIEYRYASKGSFKFETISDIKCMFGIAYSSIVQKDLDLSMSNMIRIKLERHVSQNDPDSMINVFSGLIHVRNIDSITISNFCFLDNNLKNINDDDQKIISRGTDGSSEHKIQPIKVILNNCYYDCLDSFVDITDGDNLNNHKLVNCVQNTNTLNDIPQLDLDECKGAVTPPPFTPIPASNPFSESDHFTKSNQFSQSMHFTSSNQFSLSVQFTKSNEFSASKILSNGNGDKSESDNKKNTGMIVGITVAAVAVVAGLVVLSIFLIKRKQNMINMDEDVETIDTNSNSLKNTNPIYNANGEEDPFKEDF